MNRKSYGILLVVLLALSLRILSISSYPLIGDEYGSVAEAKSVGLNWNSIVYSSLMHFWIRLGTSELWLRLPAAIFGATAVAILFKIGEKLRGWRTGMVAGLLAATSPFNIYHSQEVRFYSLFICAAAAFMLATFYYVDSLRAVRSRVVIALTGVALLFSHFLGILALYSQGATTLIATKSRWSKRALLLILFGIPLSLFGLPLIPGIHRELWHIYQVFGNAPNSTEPVMTSVSLVNLVKAAFAGFVFVFGYHVYPLRLALVIPGLCLFAFLLLAGARVFWKKTSWGVLPFAYLLAVLGVYVVLDSVGGRVASGVAPRHVAFIWPVFVLLIAMGLSSFAKPVFQLLLVAVLLVNTLSIWSGWKRDWTYGITTDYRSAAVYSVRWETKGTAVLHDGRSQDAINFYFPKDLLRVGSWRYLEGKDLSDLLGYQRLIFVTDDWETDRRRSFDLLISRLNDGFNLQDGRVDYPLFEYVLDRKATSAPPGFSVIPVTNQIRQPLSIYGLEFQDLRLPASVNFKGVPLHVIGAYCLPDSNNQQALVIPLAESLRATRLVLLTNVVGVGGLQSGQQIAEAVVEDKTAKVLTVPLHLGSETASWDKQCQPPAPCETVFQWHKRLAIVGQSAYEGSFRDFQAGLHGVALDFPDQREVVKLTIRYLANSGHLYVWGIAVG